MSPEDKVKILTGEVLIVSGFLIISSLAGMYVVKHQEKEIKKIRKAFRVMSDVAGLYESYVPPDILAEGNEKLSFAMIEIKFDE